MPQARTDVISIGTLSRNLLWKETEAVRTPHATCSLIRTGKQNILVDPGLPGQILTARLFERTGLRPEKIDTIFLTNARPAHRAGLDAFPKATIYLHELERDSVLRQLNAQLEADEDGDESATIRSAIDRVTAFKAAPDKLAPQVDLFPLFGYTEGTCGLLVSSPTHTLLIAGDAVATADHFLAGQVLPGCHNVAQAKESLTEAIEIADIIIPGHDNVMLTPRGVGR